MADDTAHGKEQSLINAYEVFQKRGGNRWGFSGATHHVSPVGYLDDHGDGWYRASIMMNTASGVKHVSQEALFLSKEEAEKFIDEEIQRRERELNLYGLFAQLGRYPDTGQLTEEEYKILLTLDGSERSGLVMAADGRFRAYVNEGSFEDEGPVIHLQEFAIEEEAQAFVRFMTTGKPWEL